VTQRITGDSIPDIPSNVRDTIPEIASIVKDTVPETLTEVIIMNVESDKQKKEEMELFKNVVLEPELVKY